MTVRSLFASAALLAASCATAQGPPVTTASELRSAIAAAGPGDVITMADGTWTDLEIVFRADGVEGDSIRLQAETPGGVLLTGTSRLRIAGDYLVVEGLRFEGGTPSGTHVIQFRDGAKQANHSRLAHSTLIDVNPVSRLQDSKWISLYGTHNRVDHNYLRGKTNAGTTLVVWLESGSGHRPTYHRIDHNHFGPRPPLGQNGGETIRIGTSDVSMQDAFVTVERNLFERCDGESEIISNKSGQNVFRGNTFFRSRGALTLRHGNGALVEGNVFIGQRVDGTGGVRVIGEDHVIVNNYFELLGGTGFESAIAIMNGVPGSPLNRYFQVRNVTIAHNTIVRARDALTIGAGADAERTLPPENVTFANNVILSEGNSIVDQEAEPINMTWDGTVYWGGSLGIDPPPGVTNANPLVQPVDGDELWRPLPESPLIDAAVAVPGLDLLVDVDGQSRDAMPDVGADEVSDAPVGRRPLQFSDVGPSWPGATAGEAAPDQSGALRLGAPVPTPTAGPATLPLTVTEAGWVEVAVHDLLGRRMAVLADAQFATGTHTLRLDPAGLALGVYLVTARTAQERATTRLVFAR